MDREKVTLTKEQMDGFNFGATFRGLFLENMIQIEKYIDDIILLFFDATPNKNEKLFMFMTFFQLRNMDMNIKQGYLTHIIRMEVHHNDHIQFKKPIELLKSLIQLRNIIAHYPINFKDNKVVFVKPDHDFGNVEIGEKEFSKAWMGTYRNITISVNRANEINNQSKIIKEYMMVLIDVFEKDIEKLKFNPRLNRLNSTWETLSKDLLVPSKGMGVFGVNLKKSKK